MILVITMHLRAFFYHNGNNDHADNDDCDNNDDNAHADNDRQSSWQGPMQRSLAGWKPALALQSGEYILQHYNHFFHTTSCHSLYCNSKSIFYLTQRWMRRGQEVRNNSLIDADQRYFLSVSLVIIFYFLLGTKKPFQKKVLLL